MFPYKERIYPSSISFIYKLYQKAAEEGITNANIALDYFYA